MNPYGLKLRGEGNWKGGKYTFIKKIKLKGAVAAGTSVFIVIITALIVPLSHFYYLFIHFAAGLPTARTEHHHLCSFYAHWAFYSSRTRAVKYKLHDGTDKRRSATNVPQVHY